MDKMEKQFEFAAQKNSVDLLWDDDDIMIVSLDLFHIDEEGEHNRNMCNISKECAEKSIPTFANKPIAFRYNSSLNGFATDVVEHFHNKEQLGDMRVAGHIPPDSRITFVARENGKVYCNCEAIIQKRLLPNLVNIINARDGNLKLSVVFRAYGVQDEETGVFVIENFDLQEVTLLGKTVLEGIEGSHMEVLKFSATEQETANVRYMQFAAQHSLSNEESIFDKIKNQRKEEIVLNNLGTKELEQRLWAKLRDYKYSDGSWTGQRYWIHNILPDTKEVIVHDNQTDELFKIPYKVSKDGDVTVKEEERKKVAEDKSYREVKNAIEFTFAKEDYGTGEKIEVDKSKDAMSETQWGNVNKTALRNKVLNAANYKSLVDDVYLRVEDGWEDAPSEKLGYPVMEIKGGKAVYNRYGLASALAYAEGEDDEAIVAKVKALYKKLDIGEEEKKEEDVANAATGEVVEGAAETTPNSSFEGEKVTEVQNAQDPKCDCDDDDLDDKDDDDDDCKQVHNNWEEMYTNLKSDYEALMTECENAKGKLKVYQDAEDKKIMSAYLEENKDAFSDDEYKVMASKIDGLEMSCEDFKNEIDAKFVAFLKDKYAKEKEALKDKTKDTKVAFIANYAHATTTTTEDYDKKLSNEEVAKRLNV